MAQVSFASEYKKATFAGGCFWCMEPPFDKLTGVVSTTSGYIGGTMKNPTYRDVSAGHSGHTEAVEVLYDPKKISYDELLKVFWRNINPTTKDQQFVDIGPQYRTGIFYHDDFQKDLALKSKEELEKKKIFGKKIVTEITKATTFWPAEKYHQDYYIKNPVRYKFYRWNSGRDQYLDKIWKK
ncbi:peptide-methionine (S)-S-oxide reductase MsrA [Halobacteriovorax sp. GB3]|uniref:peptide-methionine (S)-S-oxide reductase MsrA n=1 Tax=Halobacteriovorax sp. GB3 TaxID=2719615 RepID=UPI0023615D6F|nr:peptide-methionine (S)-S-oxide reductase MsrA [Halobacteriovorax sp. GB3]MDD0851869.1 peptide-methionine (S)-S-oxide reductase MsrA [Halobacteriovorax sp. GB3]